MNERVIMGEFLYSRGEVEFEWSISDFLSLSGVEVDWYKSPTFYFMDSLWYFKVYPNGRRSDGWIGLYLARDDKGPPKRLNFTSKIKNESLTGDKFQDVYSGLCSFEVGDKSLWGWKEFFKISELLENKSSLLPSDNLTLRCCLENAVDEAIPLRAQPMKLTELDSLSEDLGNLLDCGENYDVTLKVQDKEFRAHRSILAARCKVLAAMFQHEFSESKTGIVDIVDCDPESFGDFLRYLYTSKVEEITQDKALHLYKTADKYAVLKLKSFCVEFMMRHLSADNMSAVARLAQQHEEVELLASVQVFFNANSASVLSTKSWEKLLREDCLLANKLFKEMASEKQTRCRGPKRYFYNNLHMY